MRVQFLGTGGYHPNDRRETACIHLPDLGVVFDAGTAMYRLPAKMESDEITFFLSHAHLDHIIGLTYLLPAIGDGLLKKIRLFGAESVLDAVRTHLFAAPVFPVMPDFEFHLLGEQGEIKLTDVAVLTHQRLPSHSGGSMAYRIDSQKGEWSMAYVTDTSVDGTYTEFIRGVDLLIHECYFPDSRMNLANRTGHSYTTPVAELARDAHVGRLVCVHVNPQDDTDDPIGIPAARAIHAATEIAVDGLEIVL
ncbi:MAG: metal-dependent hydrolase [Planctomycetaceae bacterium]|nr:metal-dependent hydrolase [Planctomycetaceae bacterium]